jgi:hypothetical protein
MNARPVYVAPDLGHPLQAEPDGYDFVLTPADRSEVALYRCALEAHRRHLASSDAAASQTRLARVNGCDQPDSAREASPKTPAAGERVCLVEAAALTGGDTIARASLHMPAGEAVV